MSTNISIILDGASFDYTYLGIQTAINSLPSIGGTIIIPHNVVITGNVSDLIINKSNVSIIGVNNQTSILEVPNNINTAIQNSVLKIQSGSSAGSSKIIEQVLPGKNTIKVESLAQLQGITSGNYISIGYDEDGNKEIAVVKSVNSSTNTITIVGSSHNTWFTKIINSNTVYAKVYLLQNLITNVTISNLKFKGDGYLNLIGINFTISSHCTVSDCIFENFTNSATNSLGNIAIYANIGYGNRFINNKTNNCGHSSTGCVLLTRQSNWKLSHDSNEDIFSINLQNCFGGESDYITVRGSKSNTAGSGRAVKIMNCCNNRFSDINIEGSEDVGLLIYQDCSYNLFGNVTILGGNMGLDLAANDTNIPATVHHNYFSNVICLQQSVWSLWADGFCNNNAIANFYYNGSLGLVNPTQNKWGK